jgi:hypothetical protein
MFEEVIANQIIVPSDGLWAGVGLSSQLRVWGTMCKSIGHMYRYQAEKELLALPINVSNFINILELIKNNLINLNCFNLFKLFTAIDLEDKGWILEDQLEILGLDSGIIEKLIEIKFSKSLSNNFLKFTFIEIIDVVTKRTARENRIDFGNLKNIRINLNNFNNLKNLFNKFFKKNSSLLPIQRIQSQPRKSLNRVFKVYKTILIDLEQLKGQLIAINNL